MSTNKTIPICPYCNNKLIPSEEIRSKIRKLITEHNVIAITHNPGGIMFTFPSEYLHAFSIQVSGYCEHCDYNKLEKSLRTQKKIPQKIFQNHTRRQNDI